MSAPIKIAELERLDAASSLGPWRRALKSHDGALTERVWSDEDGPVAFTSYEGITEGAHTADAYLIAAMRNALSALLRLARASDRYAWMLSKDGPGEDEEHVVGEIVAEWVAARAAFDFTNQEPSS